MKNTRTNDESLCPLCGGRKQQATVTYTVDTGQGIVVVRNVKAKVCAQCGEEWIDNETAGRLQKIVEEAREKQHQVEVLVL